MSSAKKVVGTWLRKRVRMYGVSRQLRHGSDPTCGFVPLPQVGSGASVGTLKTGVPSPTATSPKRREVIRNLALSLWAAGHKSPDLTVGDNDLRVRSPRGGRSGAATCLPGRSAQGRLPRVRTPADRSRTPVGWSWNPTCGSRTSRRPEPSS